MRSRLPRGSRAPYRVYAQDDTGEIALIYFSARADWLASLLRLAHVVTAAAWFGASLYVLRLDASLAAGDVWRADGQSLTRLTRDAGAAREQVPLFRWQAYMAWASGFLLDRKSVV